MKLFTGFRFQDTPCCLATATLPILRERFAKYTPAEYNDVVRKARRHNQFEVHEMTASDVKDCSLLSKCFTMGKTTVDGEKIMFKNVTQMRFHATVIHP